MAAQRQPSRRSQEPPVARRLTDLGFLLLAAGCGLVAYAEWLIRTEVGAFVGVGEGLAGLAALTLGGAIFLGLGIVRLVRPRPALRIVLGLAAAACAWALPLPFAYNGRVDGAEAALWLLPALLFAELAFAVWRRRPAVPGPPSRT